MSMLRQEAPSRPSAVRQALERGAEAEAVALALREGVRGESALTDIVFHARHPERGGAPLLPHERALVREWMDIRARIVRPALARIGAGAPPTAPTPVPASGFRPIAVEHPGGARIRDKREPHPSDLVEVTGASGPVPLHRFAADAWNALVEAARRDGLPAPLFLPTSGYRSVARQAQLWADALRRYGSREEARKWVAPPGGSPHHSGRAIDFYLGGRNSSTNVENLRRLPAYLWLVRNAVRFGFYPYDREPWHWEYNPPAETDFEAEITQRLLGLFRPTIADAARSAFNAVRDRFARTLGVGPGGQVHHAIELQVLKRYPGAFTPVELNASANMRGIPPELAGRRQLHNAKIREHWDRHYRNLDTQVSQQGLTLGSPQWRAHVRRYLEAARDEADYLYGQFFSEQRRRLDWTKRAA